MTHLTSSLLHVGLNFSLTFDGMNEPWCWLVFYYHITHMCYFDLKEKEFLWFMHKTHHKLNMLKQGMEKFFKLFPKILLLSTNKYVNIWNSIYRTKWWERCWKYRVLEQRKVHTHLWLMMFNVWIGMDLQITFFKLFKTIFIPHIECSPTYFLGE